MSNVLKRIASGIGYGALIIAALLIDKYVFLAVFALLTFMMLQEFFAMTLGDGYPVSRVFAVLTALAMFLFAFAASAFGVDVKWFIIIAIPLLALMISFLFVRDRDNLLNFSYLFTGIIYIALPMAVTNFLIFDAGGSFDGMVLLFFFVIIWASDVGAYALGTALGQTHGKKLCPSISPKKSWIGVFGGLFFAMAAAAAMSMLPGLDIPLVHALGLSVTITASGICGDLFESQWKRLYNLKDSGNIIPGHGGILDRLDSSLFAIPSGVLYLMFFNLI